MIKIAIFASGNGSNALSIINYFKSSDLAEIALIVSNKQEAGVLKIAGENKIKCVFLGKLDFENGSILSVLKENNIFLIVLAGFLLKITSTLVQLFPNRIINIHPSLLPKHGGRGMYGRFVHNAVIENNDTESGITIHFVNKNYDEGGILYQKKIELLNDETIESLEKKIQELEHKYYPITIKKLIQEYGRV
jgi:phosphoribosylglycinamide formyltransferase 1